MAAKHHVNLKVVEEFLRRKIYPKEIAKDKGKMSFPVTFSPTLQYGLYYKMVRHERIRTKHF